MPALLASVPEVLRRLVLRTNCPRKENDSNFGNLPTWASPPNDVGYATTLNESVLPERAIHVKQFSVLVRAMVARRRIGSDCRDGNFHLVRAPARACRR